MCFNNYCYLFWILYKLEAVVYKFIYLFIRKKERSSETCENFPPINLTLYGIPLQYWITKFWSNNAFIPHHTSTVYLKKYMNIVCIYTNKSRWYLTINEEKMSHLWDYISKNLYSLYWTADYNPHITAAVQLLSKCIDWQKSMLCYIYSVWTRRW